MNWQQPSGKAGDGPAQPDAPKQTAAHVWDKLEHTIHNIPVRHTLPILGDFNTPLAAHPRAGRVVTKWNGRLPADASRLTKLLDDHELTHLNSWTRRAGPTYVCGEQRSLIDHVLTRHTQAHSWRVVLGVTPLFWPPGVQAGDTPFNSDSLLQGLAARHTMQDLSDCITRVLRLHLPWIPQRQVGALANPGHECACGVSCIWNKAWFHFTKFQKAHRDFHRAGRLAKHAWYSDRYSFVPLSLISPRPESMPSLQMDSTELSSALASYAYRLAEIANTLTAADELWHVLEWYRDINYVLSVQGQTMEIQASRGLKQGCLIAKWGNLRNHIAKGQCPFLCSKDTLCAAPSPQTAHIAVADPPFTAGPDRGSSIQGDTSLSQEPVTLASNT
ncbi:unnamed protein product [Symbiodinium sp. CCMP2592]|nr:unnamed protein product [Symbiodinium sp. CCMP2592]